MLVSGNRRLGSYRPAVKGRRGVWGMNQRSTPSLSYRRLYAFPGNYCRLRQVQREEDPSRGKQIHLSGRSAVCVAGQSSRASHRAIGKALSPNCAPRTKPATLAKIEAGRSVLHLTGGLRNMVIRPATSFTRTTGVKADHDLFTRPDCPVTGEATVWQARPMLVRSSCHRV